MTRNEARGILIRMQSEIENPYSTEAQALGIAIEKLERDYETEYWESQWKIDEYEAERHWNNVKHPTILPLPEEGKEYVANSDKKYERPSKKERAANALIRYCNSKASCNNCPFSSEECCQLAEVTKEGTPNEWGEGTCKVENRPIDERKDEERIIYRLEKLEAQMDDFAHKAEWLEGHIDTQLDDFERRVDRLERASRAQEKLLSAIREWYDEVGR